MKYATIVADPPWEMPGGGAWRPSNRAVSGRKTELAYSTLTVPEIAALRPSAARDAHLYLWTINSHIEAAYEVARAWGFAPSTLLVWCKAPKGKGLGGTFAAATEYVLFCRRGSLASRGRIERNWWQWPRGPHSVKPEAFLDLVEQVSPGPYLEMFARRDRLGWDTWGNEALNTAEVAA